MTINQYNATAASLNSTNAHHQTSTIYDYPQEDHSVTGAFFERISPLLEVIPEARHILQMYAHIQKQKSTGKVIFDPASYDATIDDMKYMLALAPKYRDAYNKVYEELRKESISVIEFMKSYQAFTAKGANNSGVENGYIYSYFFEMVKQKIKWSTDSIIVLNPTSFYIEKMLTEEWMHHKVALYFTDKAYADTYKFENNLMCFPIYDESNLAINGQTVCVLIMGDTLTPEEIVRQLDLISTKIPSTCNAHIYLYCPNLFLDGIIGRKTLHVYISKDMIIDTIHIIDSRAFCDIKRKHSLIELRFRKDLNQNCTMFVQDVLLAKTDNGQKLIPQKLLSVPHQLFDQNNKTLTTILRDAELKVSDRKPSNTVNKEDNVREIVFSPEIQGSATTELTTSGKHRIALTIHGKPNARQKRENNFGHGTAICKPVKGKSKKTHDEAFASAYEVLLEKESLKSKVCEMLNQDFPDETLCSLKTSWYKNLDKLKSKKHSKYNHVVAVKMFCERDEFSVGSIKMGQFTSKCAEDYLDHMLRQEVSETYIKNVFKNLICIFNLYNSPSSNPCNDVYSRFNEKLVNYQQFRDAQIRRSFSLDEARKLFKLFQADLNGPNAGLAIGGITKMLTGMVESEICALERGDIEHEKKHNLYYFNITYECPYNSTVRTELGSIEEERCVPICNQLRKIIPLSCSSETKSHRIVYNAEKGAVTPKELKYYIKTKINELNIEKVFLNVPGKGPVDINNYMGDWIRSNFDYSMRIHAKILKDDLNFIMSRNLETTDGQHYRDYRKGLRQLAICTSIDSWAEIVVGNVAIDSSKKTLVVDSVKIDHEFEGCGTPHIDTLEIQMPEGNSNELLTLQILTRFGATIIIEELE